MAGWWRSTVAVLLLLAAGCAQEGVDPRPGPSPTPTPGTGLCAGVPAVAGTDFTLRLVASGLDDPVFLTGAPGDVNRLFVVERPGRVRILAGGVLLGEPFLDIADQVGCCGERGLFSLAFHPAYASNGRLFVNYTGLDGDVIVSELTAASPTRVAAGSERQLLRIEHSRFNNHNGGQVVFGPDGFLYVGLGDGGGAGDTLMSAQDTGSLLGKILRLDVDGARLAAPGNPFANEVWALGLRNPWRMSFDRANGDLYIGDVGQARFEEIDYARAGTPGGVNYGWSAMEGIGHCFNDPDCLTRNITVPIHEYAHDARACSVTGGYVYRGCALPDLHGTYFFGDFCAGFIHTFRVVSGGVTGLEDVTARLGQSLAFLTSFGEDTRGELYVLSLSGSVFQIVPR